MAVDVVTLNRVFSAQLDSDKHWYALNSSLCCSKPVVFCSTASAKSFPDEYKLVSLEDLRGEDGAPASFRWFCSHRSSEKVYVASAFGLFLGILRLKSWTNCQFIKSEHFKMVVSSLNSRGLDCNGRDGLENAIEKSAHPPTFGAVLEAQVFPQVQNTEGMLPTPPSTPSQPNTRSPPNSESPPNCESPPNQSPSESAKTRKKKRSIEQLKVDQDLSPPSKRKKVREAAAAMMKSINQVCENNGETLGTVLGECCLMRGEDGQDARETVKSAFDTVAGEKGVRKAFSKLLSEETWAKRIECMRVPDWIYLLFKLKSRISDSGWQDLTNLTKLGRTGVSL